MKVVLVALGVAVLLAAQAVYYAVLWRGARRRDRLHRRLQSFATAETANLLRERRLARSPRLASFLQTLGFPERIEALLLQTDLETTAAGILGWGLGLALLLTTGVALLTGNVAAAALLGLPVGFGLPIIHVLANRARRSRKISTQLPDALDMMVRSLRAGHGVPAGLKLVAAELPPPIAVEFGRCFEALQMGGDFREVVHDMARRVPGNLDLRILATSLVIQHETGGNLIEILETIAAVVRERLKFFGKLRALTTEVRASGYALGAMPFVCVLAFAVLNPHYLAPLYTDPLGQAISLIGLALWVAGGLWMHRLAEVDY